MDTTAIQRALVALGLCLFLTACAPRQPMGEGLWRVVGETQNTR